MVILFHDPPPIIPSIHTVFLEPLREGTENLDPPCRESVPHAVESTFHTVVCEFDIESKRAIVAEKLFPVSLATCSTSWVNKSRHPVSWSFDERCVSRRFELSPLICMSKV